MNIENISILILLYTTGHTVREVSCPSLPLMVFVALSVVPQDQFMLIGMKLNLFSSLDLLIISKLNPSDQPSSWAVPEAGNSFLKQGQRLMSLCVLSLPAAANSQLIFLLHVISPLCCLAFGLLYLLCIVQEGILWFLCNLPRFLIMLHGQRSKIQFKVSLVRKLKRHLLIERKKNDTVLWLAWIFEMETCIHFWYIKSFSFYTVSQWMFLLSRIFSAYLRRTKYMTFAI